MFELKFKLQLKPNSQTLLVSMQPCVHSHELKMSTRTTIWKRKRTHAHEQGEQNKQCVFICYHCVVRSGAKPHAEGAPIRRRSWQTQYSGRRCPRPLSLSLSPPSHCRDLPLPLFFSLSQRQADESRKTMCNLLSSACNYWCIMNEYCAGEDGFQLSGFFKIRRSEEFD